MAAVFVMEMIVQSTCAAKDIMDMVQPSLPTASSALPCPFSAGWELIKTVELPKHGSDARLIGGFSAVAYQRQHDRLWLLSDSPQGYLVSFTGLRALLKTEQRSLRGGHRLMLRDPSGALLPEGFDGEGLVLMNDQAWIVSEGRRRPERRARLQRFSLRNGHLQQDVALPPAWQEREGQGLASNKGPESLMRTASGDLVLAAEAPLIQDRAHAGRDWVRLARLRPVAGGHPEPLDGMAIGPAGAAVTHKLGLTELLAMEDASAVLALLRSVSPDRGWTAHLAVVQMPASGRAAAPPIQPLHRWNLLSSGLPAANWEGMAWGPMTGDGRVSLVMVNDDGFSSLQRNWLSVLAPVHRPGCGPDQFAF